MERQRDRHAGFSALAIMLAVLVIGVVVSSGVLLYQHNQKSKTNGTADATKATHTTGQQPTQTDPYAGWKAYCDMVASSIPKTGYSPPAPPPSSAIPPKPPS